MVLTVAFSSLSPSQKSPPDHSAHPGSPSAALSSCFVSSSCFLLKLPAHLLPWLWPVSPLEPLLPGARTRWHLRCCIGTWCSGRYSAGVGGIGICYLVLPGVLGEPTLWPGIHSWPEVEALEGSPREVAWSSTGGPDMILGGKV